MRRINPGDWADEHVLHSLADAWISNGRAEVLALCVHSCEAMRYGPRAHIDVKMVLALYDFLLNVREDRNAAASLKWEVFGLK